MGDSLYDEYKDRLIWPAVPGVVLILISVLVGIFGNVNIIVATLRSSGKSGPFSALHTNCFAVLAVTAFFDVLHQCSHIVFAVRFFTVDYFTSLERCFLIQAVPAFAMNFSSFAYLSAGLDRLMCVSAPTWYNKRIGYEVNPAYLLVLLSFPGLYAFALLHTAYAHDQNEGGEMVVCFITDVFHRDLQRVWNTVQGATFASTVLCYASLWILIRIKNAVYVKKVTRTITLIVVALVCGWFVTTLVGIAAGQSRASEYVTFLIHTDFGWPANVGIAANFFIYYATNREYRRAFRRHWAWLWRRADRTRIHAFSKSLQMSTSV